MDEGIIIEREAQAVGFSNIVRFYHCPDDSLLLKAQRPAFKTAPSSLLPPTKDSIYHAMQQHVGYVKGLEERVKELEGEVKRQKREIEDWKNMYEKFCGELRKPNKPRASSMAMHSGGD